MVGTYDVFLAEERQDFSDPSLQKRETLLSGVCDDEAVDVHEGHLLCLHLLPIVPKHVKELNSVHREVHVDVPNLPHSLAPAELLLRELSPIRLRPCHIDCAKSVYFADGFSGTHVPAEQTVGHFINAGVLKEVLVAVRVEVIGDDVEAPFGGSYSEGAYSTEDVGQEFPTMHEPQETIPLLLQTGAPVHFLEVQTEERPYLLHCGLVVHFSSHVLQRGSPVDIMQLLCLVHHRPDVRALHESDLADYLFVGNLLGGEIVVGHMPYSFEAIGVGNLSPACLIRILLGEEIEDFLSGEILDSEFHCLVGDLGIVRVWLPLDVLHTEEFADQNGLVSGVVGVHDPLQIGHLESPLPRLQQLEVVVGSGDRNGQSFEDPLLHVLCDPPMDFVLHRYSYYMIEKTKKLNVSAHKECAQIKVAVVGDQQSGKSWFLNRYLHGDVTGYYEATLAVETLNKYIPVKNGLIHLTFWDFSGKPDFVEVRNEFYKEAHAILVFIDLSSKQSCEGVDDWLREIKDSGGTASVWLVGSKADVKKADLGKLGKEKDCPYFEISSKTNEGIDQLTEKLIGELK